MANDFKGDVGFGDKGYGDYARSRGYGEVGMGDKGYGDYASARGYAKLGMSYPDLSAPPAKLGTKSDAPQVNLSAAPPGAVGFNGKGYGSYASEPGVAANVGLGDKGYGSSARSRGYAKLGMSYPNLSAPPAKLGTYVKKR
jgi:hypothetical protein